MPPLEPCAESLLWLLGIGLWIEKSSTRSALVLRRASTGLQHQAWQFESQKQQPCSALAALSSRHRKSRPDKRKTGRDFVDEQLPRRPVAFAFLCPPGCSQQHIASVLCAPQEQSVRCHRIQADVNLRTIRDKQHSLRDHKRWVIRHDGNGRRSNQSLQ